MSLLRWIFARFQALNKEQGIVWVKKERLSSFLISDCYIEYRLAKLVSQAKVKDEKGNKIVLNPLAHEPKQPMRVSRAEVQKEVAVPQEDISLLQRCYVSMGQTPSTATDAWVSQAMIAHTTTTTSSSNTGLVTGIAHKLPRPHSARPVSSLSMLERARRSVDSGFVSPNRSISSSNSTYLDVKDSTFGESVPSTPRPTDCVCVVGDTMMNMNRGAVHVDTAQRAASPDETDQQNLQCSTSEQLASVITGTVLKYSIAEVTGQSVEDVAESSVVTAALPDGVDFSRLSLSDLSLLSLRDPGPPARAPFTPSDDKVASDDDTQDADNGDDDEDDSAVGGGGGRGGTHGPTDRFFEIREPRSAPICLLRISAVRQLKKFLHNTAGELLWNLWMDVDRLLLDNQNDKFSRLKKFCHIFLQFSTTKSVYRFLQFFTP